MAARTTQDPHPYADFLHKVSKPARYVGGESGSRRREWTPAVAKVCLAFPDVYDIGMSHLGFKILYGILNDDPRTLAERCYAPWVDLEAELRSRKLPLVSLESKQPLSSFDVVGFSLQFELTYSNILTMLDLGGIPLRSKDRTEGDPLVIAGGPVATHPEPIAPFLDALVIGDGEENATNVALTWKTLKDAGVPRAERLRALAKLGGVYVPSLYQTERDPDSELDVVARPEPESALPFPIQRGLVDLKKFPFPDESPTGGPEAIFDRMSIEVARGCTEGCRFCQAGMIYRPVRERDPNEIVDTVVSAIEKSGQDEVSLTALSTADVSCISPLLKRVTDKLAGKKVSLGVSSLRAYGLEPELLDELKRVRATGLTFAPEAGTQRMRDVINKNVTEEQLMETAERVFKRGWGKMKLYFICGLPTETEEDVRGIVATGAKALEVGKQAAGRGKPAEVVISVSVHVPKPHTPFQWCAIDSIDTTRQKQQILREEVRRVRGLKLKTHDGDASMLEGVFARGDRRLADVLELAYKNGARFDSWDDQLKLDVWHDAFDACGIAPKQYLGTIPITARLPWSHIDVGLEDGFLAREYRKALQSRLSPPCGKVAGAFVHETNVKDALAETRRLVCYDCGVACDMTAMRKERVEYLEALGSLDEAGPPRVKLPIFQRRGDGPSPKGTPPAPKEGHRYRFFYEKVGPVALIGHLDLIREIPRVFRRAGIEMVYSRGFHPKPEMTFGPALSLGVVSLHEAIDVRLAADLDQAGLDALCAAMSDRSPMGLGFLAAERLSAADPSLSKLVRGARYAVVVSRKALIDAMSARAVAAVSPEIYLAERCARVISMSSAPLRRQIKELAKMVDVRAFLQTLEPISQATLSEVRRAGFVGDLVGFECSVTITPEGAVKSSEIAETVFGDFYEGLPTQALRLELTLAREAETVPVAAPGPAPAVDAAAECLA